MKEDLLPQERNSEDLKSKELPIIKIDHLEMPIIKEESGLVLEDIDKLFQKVTFCLIYKIII